jgi:hypothetical protein
LHSGYASYIANTEEADRMRERAIFEFILLFKILEILKIDYLFLD